MDEGDKMTGKNHLFQHHDSLRAKKRKVLANIMELFTLAKEVVDGLEGSTPKAVSDEVDVTVVSMTNALKKALGEIKNAHAQFSHLTKAHEEMKEGHNKHVEKMCRDPSEEVTAWEAYALEI